MNSEGTNNIPYEEKEMQEFPGKEKINLITFQSIQ